MLLTVSWSLAGLGVGGLLGWLTLRDAVWAQALAAAGNLDGRALALAVGAVLFAGLLGTYRWKLLLPSEQVSVPRLFLVRQLGLGINNLTPVRVLGEAVQTGVLCHGDGIKLSKVLASIVLSRLFDLLIMVNLVGAGLILLPQLSGFRPFVAPLWGLTILALVLFLVFGSRLYRLPAVRRWRLLGEMVQAMETLRGHQRDLVLCLGLTAVSWMSIGVAAWLIAQAAGVGLPFWLISIVVVAVILFTGVIPAPHAAVGAYEFLTVSTLGFFAVDPSAALTFALAAHGVLLLPSLAIGLPALAMERRTLRSALAAAQDLAPDRLLEHAQ